MQLDIFHLILLLIGLLLGALLGMLIQYFRYKAKEGSQTISINNQLTASEERNKHAQSQIEQLSTETEKLEQEVRGHIEEKIVLRQQVSSLTTKNEEQMKQYEDKLKLIEDAKTKLLDSFKALSKEALDQNSKSFVDHAQLVFDKFQHDTLHKMEKQEKTVSDLIKPLSESLLKYDKQVIDLEKTRQTAYELLSTQVKQLTESQLKLKEETGRLVKALREPQVRGRYGETTLKRTVELAGMVEYCDFELQTTVEGDTGTKLRPDMVIRLPNDRVVLVDSKVPLKAYLDMLEEESEDRAKLKLEEHANQVQQHMNNLSKKDYWSGFEGSAEFVILFIPHDGILSAALQVRHELLEHGIEKRVILSTPSTLIALLRAIAYGWRQEQLTEHAMQISRIGKKLYDRLVVSTEHLERLGKSIGRAVKDYNQYVGSVESRVLSTMREFKEFGISSKKDLSVVEPIDATVRELTIKSSESET
jgi:DNA recombination protein RmuC